MRGRAAIQRPAAAARGSSRHALQHDVLGRTRRARRIAVRLAQTHHVALDVDDEPTQRAAAGCAAMWHGRRSPASGSRMAASATTSSGPGGTARMRWSSSPSTSWASSRHWFRDHAPTGSAITDAWARSASEQGRGLFDGGNEDGCVAGGVIGRTRAVAGTRATGVGRSVPLARPRAAGGRPSAGLRVARAEHRDGSARTEIEPAAACAVSGPAAGRVSSTEPRRKRQSMQSCLDDRESCRPRPCANAECGGYGKSRSPTTPFILPMCAGCAQFTRGRSSRAFCSTRTLPPIG